MKCPLCGSQMFFKEEIDGCWERYECRNILINDFCHYIYYPQHPGSYDALNEKFFIDVYDDSTAITDREFGRTFAFNFSLEFSTDIFERAMNLMILA